jgi:prevent-host-death family protein
MAHRPRTTGVADLKARLSLYLRRVKAGEEILVTERGVPIARLVPVGDRAESGDELAELERQGLLRIGTGRLPSGFWKLPRGRDPHGLVRGAVDDERSEGW